VLGLEREGAMGTGSDGEHLVAFLLKQRKNWGEQWVRLIVCVGEGEAQHGIELRRERGGVRPTTRGA
jgi:hypothetical protein